MKYLNTDLPLRNFRRTLKGKIYVDKSGLIEPLNELIGTEGCYVCITRPRRFGKTINANMLGAYYTKGYNSHDIFKNLQISQSNLYEEHLNQYNVMYIDFSHMPDICESYQDYIKSIRKKIYGDLYAAFPEVDKDGYDSLNDLLLATNSSFIFILDEWDSIF